MTFSQMMLLIAAVGLVMCALDALLGFVYKDWKSLPWEDEERNG